MLISVNAYISANFPKRIQQRIRQEIKRIYKNPKEQVDAQGNKIEGYRSIFLDHVDAEMPRSKFLMGIFPFRKTGDGLFWLKYKKGLERQELNKIKKESQNANTN